MTGGDGSIAKPHVHVWSMMWGVSRSAVERTMDGSPRAWKTVSILSPKEVWCSVPAEGRWRLPLATGHAGLWQRSDEASCRTHATACPRQCTSRRHRDGVGQSEYP